MFERFQDGCADVSFRGREKASGADLRIPEITLL